MNKETDKYFALFSYLYCQPLFKSKLFEFFNYDIRRCYEAKEKDLEGFNDIYDVKVPNNFFVNKSKLNPDECLKSALNLKGVGILTYNDEKYPPLLKEIPDFPLSLYYLGDLENMNYNNMLSIVGSRHATNSAKGALNSIISGLNNSDITIVSGLAYGIDSTAHEAALDNNLKTIAVIGTGLDKQYPSSNKKLYRDILDSGNVIFSEYHLGIEAKPYNFPLRNRIVVGMSEGTLVAEAQTKSGAMISANLTIDYNRELMCIPGNVLNPNTSGIYQLIKNGAGIVTSTDDLLNNLGWDIIHNETQDDLSNDVQKNILDIISYGEASFDEIAKQSKLDTSTLMVVLTELELKGLIKQSNNKYYKNK